MRFIFFYLFVAVSSFCSGQAQTWLGKKEIDLSPFVHDKPHLENLQCFEVTYLSEGLIVNGILLEPRGEELNPAIIFNRGGNREFAVLSTEMIISVLGKVASEGYVVTASNYRWEDEYGGADTNDVLNLLQITKNLSNVDSARIGMMGWSRGALMTCLALRGSHGIKSTVLVSGAPNLFSTLRERPGLEENVFSKYIPNYFEQKEKVLTDRSPHFWPEKLNRETALLMLNGTNDRHVDYRQSVHFSEKLDSIGFPHTLQLYETNHSFFNMRPKLDSILLDWFNRTLKNESKQVAITIDDVPNTRNFSNNGFSSKLLEKLDSLSIPVTIFINEGLIYRGDTMKNKELLHNWIERSYVTAGNHTYSHSRYSQVGFDAFSKDVFKGEALSKEICSRYSKELTYFRFPYNDLGIDSTEHVKIDVFLEDQKYISTPFTIETSDWMFNALYKKYLQDGDTIKAKEIGQMYVEETMRSFAFYDSLALSHFNERVKQIYLCHDNLLNEDFLPGLVDSLKKQGYDIVSLENALQDPVYKNEDVYFKKWGISWFYRWMTSEDRKKWMHLEPNLGGVEERYLEEFDK